VFNYMDCPHFAKRTIAQGIGKMIEIRNHIGTSASATVEPDGARIFINPAAYIQNWQGRE
jgi:hypothetical protein